MKNQHANLITRATLALVALTAIALSIACEPATENAPKPTATPAVSTTPVTVASPSPSVSPSPAASPSKTKGTK